MFCRIFTLVLGIFLIAGHSLGGTANPDTQVPSTSIFCQGKNLAVTPSMEIEIDLKAGTLKVGEQIEKYTISDTRNGLLFKLPSHGMASHCSSYNDLAVPRGVLQSGASLDGIFETHYSGPSCGGEDTFEIVRCFGRSGPDIASLLRSN